MSNHITMIVNNEYIQCKDGDEVIYDSRWSLEEFLNGGKRMKTTKEQIINEIEEIIKYNKAARQAEVVELCKDATRKSNDVLAKARNYIKSSDEYRDGAEEVWNLTKLLVLSVDDGGISNDKIYEIFDKSCMNVIRDYSIDDVINKYKAYEKKKEEEAAKPKLGDVVEVIRNHDGFIEKGIFLARFNDNTFTYIATNRTMVEAGSDYFTIKKTGEHIDIQGMLDKIA